MGQGGSRSDERQQADDALLTPLGEFMQRRNAELGLSVSAVAQRVGMSRATWYRLARGESAAPGVRVLRGLARVYRVRMAELFALAAWSDAQPDVARTRTVAAAREAGDVLWRCRYEPRVRCGAWIEVDLELRNLSDQPWLAAEVRGLHDAWIALNPGAATSAPARAEARGAVRCGAPLPPTAAGEWVKTRLNLPAPWVVGASVYCLVLHADPARPAQGAGTFLVVEAR